MRILDDCHEIVEIAKSYTNPNAITVEIHEDASSSMAILSLPKARRFIAALEHAINVVENGNEVAL